MSEREDGGPAFPSTHDRGTSYIGMTLRDWFAGQALAGVLPREDITGTEARLQHVKGAIAHLAYAYADAMLEARK